MNHVDYLRQQRDVYASAWLQFSHAYRKASAEIFAFFEGHDDLALFMPELRRRGQHTSIAIRPFVCRGKRPVLKLIPVVRRRLDRPWRALFFVDKDIDNFINPVKEKNDPFLYETQWYSIENYFVSEETYRWVWTDLLRLSDLDPRLEKTLEIYRILYKRFSLFATTLMAWSLFHRKHGRRPNLNNLNLSKLLRLDSSGKMLRQGKFGKLLDQSCGVATPPRSWRSIRAAANQLRQHEKKSYIRGKFELWFFLQFTKLSMQILPTMPPPKHGNTTPSTAFTLTPENAVTLLSGRGQFPPDAIEFLDIVWKEIAKSPL
jgi:hypothetical protein